MSGRLAEWCNPLGSDSLVGDAYNLRSVLKTNTEHGRPPNPDLPVSRSGEQLLATCEQLSYVLFTKPGEP